MAALYNRAGHYIALWFLSFFFFLSFFSFVACLKCAARGSLKIQDAKKSPFEHHRTGLSACIFAAKACIDNRKKNLLNNDTSSTRPRNMVNFGLLTAEICWRVWGTPTHFNAFHVLAALLHGTLVVSVSQTLRR